MEEEGAMGSKRRMGETGEPILSGTRDELEEQLKELNRKLAILTMEVGEGIHRQPVVMALIQHTQSLERRLGELEVCVFRSYEVPLDCEYVQEAAKMRELWRATCRRVKGTGTKVGSIKNYTFAGYMIALSREPRLGAEDRGAVAKEMLDRMSDGTGKLDLSKAVKLDDMVGQASVTKGAKVAYINVKMHDKQENLAAKLDGVLAAIGKSTWDTRSPEPVAKEIRKVMEQEKVKGSGKGRQ